MKAMFMNRISNRIIAVFMAVTMAVSSLAISFSLPSIDANAATVTSDNLVARYFVNDTNTNEVGPANLINNGNSIVWSAEEGAAHFNADNEKRNYLKVKFSDVIPNANYISGMTISFMAKDSSRSNSWQRYFEITCARPYSGDYNSYIYSAVNGAVRAKNVGYNNEETTNISYGDADGSWHRFTIVIDNNYIILYRDGVEKDSTSNINIINQGFYDALLENGYFVFGASTYNDPAYEGYLKDFRIYNASLTRNDINNEDGFLNCDSRDLQNAIATYEQKMDGTNAPLKNTKPAYDAYVVANRYLDAVNYGDAQVETSELLKVKNTLTAATNNMSEWKQLKFTSDQPSFTDDDTHGNSYYYDKVCKNLLWCSDVTYDSYTLWGEEQGVYVGSNKNTVQPAIFRPSAIMVYDGTDPSLPVMFLERLWKGGAFGGQLNMWTFYAGIKEGKGMYLNENWHGTDGKLNYLYCYNYNFVGGLNHICGEVDSFDKISRNNSKGEYKYYYANKMLFSGNSFGPNEYSRKITNIKWNMLFSNNDDPYYDNGDSHYKDFVGTEGDKKGIQSNEVEQPLYVINYKAVIDEMAKYKASILKVSNYKEGGLSSLLEKVDALADFDMLKEYTFDENSFDNVERCGNKIGQLINDVRTQSANHKTIYGTLRQQMNKYKVYYQVGNLKTYYSESSADAFLSAYDNAKAKMAELQYNDYSTNEQEIIDLSNAIADTYNGLERLFVLTFNDLDGNLIDTIRVEKGTSPADISAIAPQLPESGIEGDYIIIYAWDNEITTASQNATYTMTRTQGYDVSAYNTVVALANECIADSNKFSKTERDGLATVLEENKVVATSTLDEIDAYTAAITTAINNLDYRKCNVKYIYQIDNEATTIQNVTYRYGDTVTALSPQNAVAYKWTYTLDDNDVILASGTDTADFVVNGDMVINVYASSTKSIQNDSKTRVILLDKSDRVVSISYASVGSSIIFRDTIFSVGGVNSMSEKIPFYTARGFILDGEEYHTGNSYTITDSNDVIIHSIYNA